jgi:uncharacterized protein (DUF4415 family)
MPKPSQKPDHISQEDWDAVDSPPLTKRMLDGMRPVRDSMSPEIFAKLTKARGPQKTPTKEAVSLRLDRDVLEHFRAKGRGWQTEINDVLRQSAKSEAVTASKNPKRMVPRSAVSGAFTTKAATGKMPKTASKEAAPNALTQHSGLSPATRRDKKRRK